MIKIKQKLKDTLDYIWQRPIWAFIILAIVLIVWNVYYAANEPKLTEECAKEFCEGLGLGYIGVGLKDISCSIENKDSYSIGQMYRINNITEVCGE